MKYVALLRGIGPTNPNMHPKKLKSFFEGLGFKNVATVIASGNVVFESSSKSISALEKRIETALPQKLGFKSTTIVRSKNDLEKLVKKDPYAGAAHDRKNYSLVTFLKNHSGVVRSLPVKGKGFAVKGKYKKEIAFLITDLGTPDFMRELEKQLGKEITSRTWKTVQRILAKMDV